MIFIAFSGVILINLILLKTQHLDLTFFRCTHTQCLRDLSTYVAPFANEPRLSHWYILNDLVRTVISHHTGSKMCALCVKRILPKLVASYDQWALRVTNICPFTAYFALHYAKICIQCKRRKFCKPVIWKILFCFLASYCLS